MKTLSNKQFKSNCNDAELEYARGGEYNFYIFGADFWFNYQINTHEFTEKGTTNLSESQLLFIENKIIEFDEDRKKNKDRKEQEEKDDKLRSDFMEDSNPYDDAYFNSEYL